MGSAVQQGGRTSNRIPCSLAPQVRGGGSCFLIRGEGRAGFWNRAGGWLRRSAHPLGGAECRGHMQYPAFSLYTLLLFLTSQKLQLSSLAGAGGAFLYLFVHNLPQLHMHAVSFSSLFSEGENNSFESDRQLRCLEGRIGFHREWWCYNGLVM